MNFVNFGGHYINMDLVTDILTNEKRANWNVTDEDYRPSTEESVVFVTTVAATNFDGHISPSETVFFSPQREVILDWLQRNISVYAAVDLPPKRVLHLERAPAPLPDDQEIAF